LGDFIESGPQQGFPRWQLPFRACPLSFAEEGKSAIWSITSPGMIFAVVAATRKGAPTVQEGDLRAWIATLWCFTPAEVEQNPLFNYFGVKSNGVVVWGEVFQLIRFHSSWDICLSGQNCVTEG
jgi:hypothetical protein